MQTKILIFVILAAGLFLLSACQENASEDNRIIHTVKGPINAEDLEFTLTHEHIMSNFGADIDETPQYDNDK